MYVRAGIRLYLCVNMCASLFGTFTTQTDIKSAASHMIPIGEYKKKSRKQQNFLLFFFEYSYIKCAT